ncbi:Serine/threonine-protein kinase PknL [Hartmannibacter diazotrophicus]|uniref:Serine/threonine-protein kinase PknL n=2 Tax=Hartmannibacter diazotrophicus TaxID=1482074 RepID=A0A2C9D3P9_9HYPH|nr:Serine/threonine-protein kinase PknL [Hartmannibacter diazotrophicus]
MGVVYEGHDPSIDRVVAIKALHTHLASAAERTSWLERFAREAKAAGRVIHPNLVTIFDYLEVEDTPYLVMEYVEAGTLAERLEADHILPPAEIRTVMGQILDGLAAIHQVGIVHRDIKPANVLLFKDGRVKLADFGVARIESLGATQGGLIGTPHYMSPEQFNGGQIDQRSDMFACGVILYEMLTGQKPYAANGLGELSVQVLRGRYNRLGTRIAHAPERLNALMDKALTPELALRVSDVGEFKLMLEGALEGVDQAVPPPQEGTVVAPLAPASGSLGSRPDGSMSGTLAERMPKTVFSGIESLLAERVGPIARIIVRSAATSTNDVDRMIESLAAHLGEDERAAFREAIQRCISQTSDQVVAAGEEDDLLQTLTRLLTPHVGPMARILVKKAAERSRSREELCSSLAGHIPNAKDREEFLAKVG